MMMHIKHITHQSIKLASLSFNTGNCSENYDTSINGTTFEAIPIENFTEYVTGGDE